MCIDAKCQEIMEIILGACIGSWGRVDPCKPFKLWENV